MTNPFSQQVDPFEDRQRQRAAEQQSQILEIEQSLNSLIPDVFLSAGGELLLQKLEQLYILQPTCPPGYPEGWGFYREGQNSVVFRLRKMVEKAKKVSS